MSATNGIAPQTTSKVRIDQPVQGFANQSWGLKFPTCRYVSSQLKTPNSKSTIHDHTATATTTGVAQTKISPAARSTISLVPAGESRRAISVPDPIVRETAAAVKASVRKTTCQKT